MGYNYKYRTEIDLHNLNMVQYLIKRIKATAAGKKEAS